MSARHFWIGATLSALAACGTPVAPPADGGGVDAPPPTICASDTECDDTVYCNGAERCAPASSAADARGCTPSPTPRCAATETCIEAMRTCTATACSGGAADADHDGHASIACHGDDCDDHDAMRYPTNPEVCDSAGHDEDCDPATIGPDLDHDGFVSTACCAMVSGGTLRCGTDCDDTLVGVNPGTPESCNGIDDNCNGMVDEGTMTSFYPDCDGDRYGAIGSTATTACEAPSAPPSCTAGGGLWATTTTDCDDTDARANPGSTETCDGIDDDCDGMIDEGFPLATYAPDCDGDGAGDAAAAVVSCMAPATGPSCSTVGHTWIIDASDCDDTRPDVHPGAAEICNGLDDDCDGTVDGAPADATCNVTTPVHATGPAVCSAGVCSYTCSGGYLDCDSAPATYGCETDGTSSQNDCGACSNACGVGHCAASACTRATITQFGVGWTSTCARLSDGTASCWGDNSSGQLGDGTMVSRPTPAPVPSLSSVVSVSVGRQHACALLTTGHVRCWGDDSSDQLGDRMFITRTSPVDVAGITDATQLAVGPYTNCVRRATGAVVCWGRLPLTPGFSLATIAGITDATMVAVGDQDHQCALRAGGGVACWGDNTAGELGDGTRTSRSSAVAMVGASSVAEVSCGYEFTCIRRTTGAVSCVGGFNSVGTLGDGSGTDHTALVAASGLTDATTLSTSNDWSCSARTSGTPACWGQGGSFTTFFSASTPTSVPGVAGATRVYVGNSHACATFASGPAYCWGVNSSGELGNGTITDVETTPVAVLGS